MLIIGIDPGPEKSGFCLYHHETPRLIDVGYEKNRALLMKIKQSNADGLACENVKCYGMNVGQDIFDSLYWIGRFMQCWMENHHRACKRIFRGEVCAHFCNNPKATKPQIKRVLMDRFGEMPTKKKPVAFYGPRGDIRLVGDHMWDSLAIAVCYADTKGDKL